MLMHYFPYIVIPVGLMKIREQLLPAKMRTFPLSINMLRIVIIFRVMYLFSTAHAAFHFRIAMTDALQFHIEIIGEIFIVKYFLIPRRRFMLSARDTLVITTPYDFLMV
ncbi:MAG TPA: hypothetical protein DHW02_05035 [Ktedonobacter sp.]|nr:hypothetical protein [Ktedonobacter sp.]